MNRGDELVTSGEIRIQPNLACRSISGTAAPVLAIAVAIDPVVVQSWMVACNKVDAATCIGFETICGCLELASALRSESFNKLRARLIVLNAQPERIGERDTPIPNSLTKPAVSPRLSKIMIQSTLQACRHAFVIEAVVQPCSRSPHVHARAAFAARAARPGGHCMR